MDRKRHHLIALGAALAVLAVSAAAQAPVSLRASSWLSENGRIEALATEPLLDRTALLERAWASDMAMDYTSRQQLRDDLLIGEFLFKTPILLGGQAAKAGISCHSCHVNGRDNPHFQFPAISSDPGTADTTHSFFSKTLGNGNFDPVAIPDLAQGGKVPHDLESRELERFVRTIVVEEFGGSNGNAEVIRPLVSFTRALRVWGGEQEANAVVMRSLEQDIADVFAMVELAKERSGDAAGPIAVLLLAGARDRLLQIHERMIPGTHDTERTWVVEQSRALGRAQRDLRDRRSIDALLDDWREGWNNRGPDLAAAEPTSLYNPEVLRSFFRK